MQAIKEHSIVAYLNPLPEDLHDGQYPVVYQVIEDNGDRVLMEVYWSDLPIKPSYVAQKSDLRLAFQEHTDILVPEFLDLEVWQDNSWRNDETASAQFTLNDQYAICLWVWDESYEDTGKYTVCLLDTKNGWITYGTQCRTDEEAIKAIEEHKTNWQTMIKTEKWL